MATGDKRIDQLDPVSTLDLTSLMAMQQGTTAKKLTLEQLLNYLNAHVDAGNAVLYVAQTLTDAQKLQARTNIGAAAPGEGGGGSTANAVLYVSQTLTEGQQAQARKNIRCGSVGDVASDCVASGEFAHSEGDNTVASGKYSHAEGFSAKATAGYAHAEGGSTLASGVAAHSEGLYSEASGRGSHTEGWYAKAIGENAHAEGSHTEASGENAHAEGGDTVASGKYSHAEGFWTKAIGKYSHAEGYVAKATADCSHVQGKYNLKDPNVSEAEPFGKYAHIVGNGTDSDNPSNAHTLDWDGVPWFKGRAQCLGNAQDDGAQTVMLNGDTEITLTDRTTGVKYNLHIDNGKLMIEVVS